MEVTRDLDKSSFGIEVGTEAWLESAQEIGGRGGGNNEYSVETVKILFVKKRTQ